MRALRDTGVTIILTTHYIEEAEEMADRIGVINKGEIILVEDKAELMRKLGKKQLTLQLAAAARGSARRRSPPTSSTLVGGRQRADLHLRHARPSARGITALLQRPRATPASRFKDLQTEQSSLEDIFVEPGRGTTR